MGAAEDRVRAGLNPPIGTEPHAELAGRMAPATDRLYQAVASGTVTHDGDDRFAAHVGNCVAEATPLGDLVSKDKKGSPRKIDAAVAAIVASDRAAWPMQRRGKVGGRRAMVQWLHPAVPSPITR